MLDLPLTVTRTRAILSATPHLRYDRMQRCPMLTPSHVERRKTWANSHVTWTDDQWYSVVWSDEKKFNLDGPDGWGYYWHDLRKEKKLFSKRQNGGGSVMVWAAFSGAGKSALAFIEGRQNAISYCQTLEEYMLPYTYCFHGESFIFQQDGASIHTANVTKQWFQLLNIDTLDWPARSPDLNPIENLWAILARNVYKSCRQFHTTDELRNQILLSWSEIGVPTLQKLYKSMPMRCIKVIENRGRKIDY